MKGRQVSDACGVDLSCDWATLSVISEDCESLNCASATFAGLLQLIVIDVVVDVVKVGFGDPDGGMHVFTSKTGDFEPSPLKFSAETANWY